MAVLKVKTTVQALGRLMDELQKSPNQFQVRAWPAGADAEGPGWPSNLVRVMPGDRKFDGHNIEAHLELLETYPTRKITPTSRTTGLMANVERDLLDRLCDFLDIFPRVGISQDDLDKIERLAKMIRERAEGSQDGSLVTNLPHCTIRDSSQIIEICEELRSKL